MVIDAVYPVNRHLHLTHTNGKNGPAHKPRCRSVRVSATVRVSLIRFLSSKTSAERLCANVIMSIHWVAEKLCTTGVVFRLMQSINRLF